MKTVEEWERALAESRAKTSDVRWQLVGKVEEMLAEETNPYAREFLLRQLAQLGVDRARLVALRNGAAAAPVPGADDDGELAELEAEHAFMAANLARKRERAIARLLRQLEVERNPYRREDLLRHVEHYRQLEADQPF